MCFLDAAILLHSSYMAFDGLNPSSLEQPVVAPTELEHLTEEEAAYIAAERLAKQEMQAQDAVVAGSSGKFESPIVEAQIEAGTGVDPLITEIESVLSVDLTKVLKEPLSTEASDRFVADEKLLAHRIFIEKDKLEARDMVLWIGRWLHQLPGVNKYYLEQEARNKTEAIIALIHDGSS